MKLTAEHRYILWPCLLGGLALYSPVLAGLGLLLLWVSPEREPALHFYAQPFYSDRPLWWLVPLGVVVALFVARHPFPTDDLLRDMTAWAWHYDYRDVFWGSPRVPGYDQYWGFDRLAGWVYRTVPHRWAPLVFQMAALLGFLGVFAVLLGQKLKRHPLRWTLVSIGLAWALYTPVLTRIVSARPEIFFTVWALAAFLAAGRRFWLWLAVGLLLSPGYWLAGAYSAAFWVLPGRSIRFRLVGSFLFGLTTVLLWEVLSHGLWLPNFLNLSGMIAYRVYGVAEDNGLSVFLQLPSVMALPVVLALLPWRLFRTQASSLFLFLWFCIPWMIRYVDILFPLGLVLLVEGLDPAWGLTWPPERLARLRWVVFFGLLSVPWGLVPLENPTLLQVPGSTAHPSRVLAPFGPKVYDTLYANPGTIRMAPAMDPGMTKRSLQYLVEHLAQASCATLQASRAQYLVTEQNLPVRPCLHRLTVRNGWSLWQILPKKKPEHRAPVVKVNVQKDVHSGRVFRKPS